MTDLEGGTASEPTHPFDRATAVRRQENGAFIARPSADYWAFVSPFGGATAATVLRALLQHEDCQGEPIALTVNFAAPIERGDYQIDFRRVRSNRSTQHWSVEILQGDDPEPRATATAVFAERRASWSYQSIAPPDVRPRRELTEYDPGSTVPWVSRYRFHFDTGAPVRSVEPFQDSHPAHSLLWLSDAPERQIDVYALAAMADAFFGRIFQVRGAIVPFGTVSLTTYFQTDAEELHRLAPRSLIGRAEARRFHRSFSDQTGELWSPDGRLLATTHQIAFFKA